MSGFKTWEKVDAAAHWLHGKHLLPRRVKSWTCDRFDLALGLTPEELRRDWTDGDVALTERQIRDRLDRENWTPTHSLDHEQWARDRAELAHRFATQGRTRRRAIDEIADTLDNDDDPRSHDE